MHYVTQISYRMQKHKLGVTCPNVLFLETHWAHSRMKKGASTFRSPDATKCTM
jgi:hypothetical protein